MTLPFTKMHGCGNDFVIVDTCHTPPGWCPSPHDAALLLDRHYGIGGDQLLVLTRKDSDAVHARMDIYNADGSRVEMCGNGIRCCARYLCDSYPSLPKTLRIETDAGIITPTLIDTDVQVDMGPPRLMAEDIPVTGMQGCVVGVSPPTLSDGYNLPSMTCVSMGNPHAVFFVDTLEDVPLTRLGPAIETHPWFPQRINVHFAQMLSDAHIRMRVWERGSGVTLACGTGACATAVAAILTHNAQRTLQVDLPGGSLSIAWPHEHAHVLMTGPATYVCTGVTSLLTDSRV